MPESLPRRRSRSERTTANGRRAARRRRGAATVLVLAALACVLGGVVAAPWIDRQNVEPVECTVTSAAAGSSSGAGRGGVESAVIAIKTSDCGELVFSNGVTRDNRDELAAELNAGGRFEFGLGPISRWLKEAGSPFGRHPEVQSVTKVR